MKTLVLVRHAKSSWDNPNLPDFERPLNQRGEENAPFMAQKLKELGVVPTKFLSSAAVRAFETCRFFAETFDFELDKVKKKEELYACSSHELLGNLRKIKEKHDCIILFGHNPELTEFLNKLANVKIENIPTCGIAVIDFGIEKWDKIAFGKGQLKHFLYPKAFFTQEPKDEGNG